MRRRRLNYFIATFTLIFLYYYIGIGDYISTRSFDDEFDYPLNVDILPLINEVTSGKEPSVKPINYYPYRFLSNSGKCKTMDKLDLVIVVKSAMKNFANREVIRKTWGQEHFLPGRMVKRFFFLGIDESFKSETQKLINEEMAQHNDIIQIDFIDNYYNNTIKTMMSFRWIYQHCAIADYYLFSDDDMYVSIKNVLEFTESRSCGEEDNSIPSNELTFRKERDDVLFAGFVFKSTPHRIRSSKWRVSLDEYPWNQWPPYVTAGAYIVSNSCMKTLYVGSLFVKHFRFDDVYLGIVAKKVGITPLHCPEFYYFKKVYSKSGYKNVIASHGYSDNDELVLVWNEQNRHE